MKTKTNQLEPAHPGVILRRTMEDLAISSYALAKATGKTPTQIHRIVNCKASITANMARLLGEALGTSAQMWLNLQSRYDLDLEKLERPEIEATPLVADGRRVS